MLDGIPVANLTAPGLVAIIVLMILLGKLVPRKIHQDKIDECKSWQLVAETEREARLTSDKQTAELLEVAKVTHALMVAVFKVQSSEHAGEVGEQREAS